MKKIAPFLLIPLLLVAILAGALLLFFTVRLPAQSGSEKITGLSAQTKIIRDAHGVPHIFANSINDGFTALGYLHASDRLFQMEMMRRAGSGRLSEILGKDLIQYDKKMRALGFYALIEPYYKDLSDDTRAALDAYAVGVNAYLAKGGLPAEFALLGFKPAEWRPWDGLIWAKMMAWQLSANWEDEVLREQLLQKKFTKDQIEAMYPIVDHDVPTPLKPMEWVRRPRQPTIPTYDPLPQVMMPSDGSSALAAAFERLPHTASNAYVISGAHTKSKKPILANDPHLQLQAPILWYLARIITPQGELKGASVPGVPFFALGQNSHVAWGFTTSNMDVEDVTFIPADSKGFTTRREIIHVKDAPDAAFSVEENHQGVILSDIVNSIQGITPLDKKALFQFTGFAKGDRTADALFHMNMAQSVSDIESATNNYSVPPQNLVYADKDGHVGYMAVGTIPKRSNDGFYAHENKPWQGIMSQTPRMKDPKEGVLLTANQAVVDDKNCAAFTCVFARGWGEPYRAMRLEGLFADAFSKNELFDVSSASLPQLDVSSAAMQRFLPVMMSAVQGRDPYEKEMLAALLHWDGRMLRDRPEPLIYHTWIDALMRKVFRNTYNSDVKWPRMAAMEQQRLVDELVQESFHEAASALQKRYGHDWKIWRWGDKHVAPLAHLLWSHVPLIGELTSLETETDGDGYTLRRAAPGNYAKPFEVEHGAGYRGVYDLNDPSQSLFMIAGGESGQLFSPHYGNLLKAWNEGSYITLTGDEVQLMQKGGTPLTLTP